MRHHGLIDSQNFHCVCRVVVTFNFQIFYPQSGNIYNIYIIKRWYMEQKVLQLMPKSGWLCNYSMTWFWHYNHTSICSIWNTYGWSNNWKYCIKTDGKSIIGPLKIPRHCMLIYLSCKSTITISFLYIQDFVINITLSIKLQYLQVTNDGVEMQCVDNFHNTLQGNVDFICRLFRLSTFHRAWKDVK